MSESRNELAEIFDALWQSYEGNTSSLEHLGHFVRLHHKAIARALRSETAVPVTAIHLFNIGKEVRVRFERDGKWYDAITEHADGAYSHIIEVSGMNAAPQAPAVTGKAHPAGQSGTAQPAGSAPSTRTERG